LALDNAKYHQAKILQPWLEEVSEIMAGLEYQKRACPFLDSLFFSFIFIL
jgi:hypothetical protein